MLSELYTEIKALLAGPNLYWGARRLLLASIREPLRGSRWPDVARSTALARLFLT